MSEQTQSGQTESSGQRSQLIRQPTLLNISEESIFTGNPEDVISYDPNLLNISFGSFLGTGTQSHSSTPLQASSQDPVLSSVLRDPDSEMADVSMSSDPGPKVHAPLAPQAQSHEASRMALPTSPSRQTGHPQHGLPQYIVQNKLPMPTMPVSILVPSGLESPAGRSGGPPPGFESTQESDEDTAELVGVDKQVWSIFKDHDDDPPSFKKIKNLYRQKYRALKADAKACGFPDQTQECRNQVQDLWREYLRQQYLVEYQKPKQSRQFPERYEEVAELTLKQFYRNEQAVEEAAKKAPIDVSIPWTGDSSMKIGHVAYMEQIERIYKDWKKQIPSLVEPSEKTYENQWGEFITNQRRNCRKRCKRKERTLTMKEEWFWWNVKSNMLTHNPAELDDLPTWGTMVKLGWDEPRTQVFQRNLIENDIHPEVRKDPEDTRLDVTASVNISTCTSASMTPKTQLAKMIEEIDLTKDMDVDEPQPSSTEEKTKSSTEPDSQESVSVLDKAQIQLSPILPAGGHPSNVSHTPPQSVAGKEEGDLSGEEVEEVVSTATTATTSQSGPTASSTAGTGTEKGKTAGATATASETPSTKDWAKQVEEEESTAEKPMEVDQPASKDKHPVVSTDPKLGIVVTWKGKTYHNGNVPPTPPDRNKFEDWEDWKTCAFACMGLKAGGVLQPTGLHSRSYWKITSANADMVKWQGMLACQINTSCKLKPGSGEGDVLPPTTLVGWRDRQWKAQLGNHEQMCLSVNTINMLFNVCGLPEIDITLVQKRITEEQDAQDLIAKNIALTPEDRTRRDLTQTIRLHVSKACEK